MHDLMTIYRKVRKTLKSALKPSLGFAGNLNFYPQPLKMSDLGILSLSITAECLEIDFFEDFEINLQVPYRRNQKDFNEYPQTLKIQRKRIEAVFSPYCDRHKIKRKLAKLSRDYKQES